MCKLNMCHVPQLEWLTNFVLLVVSLLGCSVGAGLIGFYQLHLLSFISPELFIIPLVLLGKRCIYLHLEFECAFSSEWERIRTRHSLPESSLQCATQRPIILIYVGLSVGKVFFLGLHSSFLFSRWRNIYFDSLDDRLIGYFKTQSTSP